MKSIILKILNVRLGEILVIVVPVVIFFAAFELYCYTKMKNRSPEKRTISGYTVFKQTPGCWFDTQDGKTRLEEKQKADENGFLSDAPITLDKPPNSFRIFLNGGSVAMGAGQTQIWPYPDVRRYPESIFAYRFSIAGHLKEFLKTRFPGTRIEVISVGTFQKQLHQSLIEYLTTLSKFSPDCIINMDGYNDLPTFQMGHPYETCESKFLPSYISLYNLEHYPYFFQFLVKLKIWPELRRRPEPGERNIQLEDPLSTYKANRDKYVSNSKRFLHVLNHYAAVVRADNTKFIFVLQPWLLRSGNNKELSAIEAKYASLISKTERAPLEKFLVDDFLGVEIQKLVAESGFEYIDLGKEMKALDSSFEFYTDSCHITELANRFIAEAIGEKLVNVLQRSSQKAHNRKTGISDELQGGLNAFSAPARVSPEKPSG